MPLTRSSWLINHYIKLQQPDWLWSPPNLISNWYRELLPRV